MMLSQSFKKIIVFLIFNFCVLNVSYAAEIEANENNALNRLDNDYNSYGEFFDLYQPYLKNIKPYKSMYFLVGSNPEKSKLQLSFRYQLFDQKNLIANDHEWLQGLNFGYTQTSFWDLKSASQPFKDTSYKPELFFLSSNFFDGKNDFKGIFFQVGLQHESNGQAGDNSRATNIFYLKPIFMLYNQGSFTGVQIAPQIWTYVENDDDTNYDLKDYRGYFDLELKIGEKDDLILESHFRPAKEGNSVQVDLTLPIRKYIDNSVGVYFQVQYVNGLAENMLNYRDRTEAIRFGISFIR